MSEDREAQINQARTVLDAWYGKDKWPLRGMDSTLVSLARETGWLIDPDEPPELVTLIHNSAIMVAAHIVAQEMSNNAANHTPGAYQWWCDAILALKKPV